MKKFLKNELQSVLSFNISINFNANQIKPYLTVGRKFK